MKVVRKCKICEKKFNYFDCESNRKRNYEGGKYCSYKCSHIGRDKRIEKPCKNCGILFKGNIFCSKKCKDQSETIPRIDKKCLICGKNFKYNPNRLKYKKLGKFCSISCGLKNSNNALGKKHSEKARKEKSERMSGSKSNFWKGGVTKINHTIRCSLEYRLWREAVFKRDDWTCVWCGKRGCTLNADHIKPFALFPELRFLIDNGRTLCVNCHKKTDTYCGRGRWNKKYEKNRIQKEANKAT